MHFCRLGYSRVYPGFHIPLFFLLRIVVPVPAANALQIENDDYCSACGGNGDLICCDSCSKSFHFECVDLVGSSDLPDDWFCNDCIYKRSAQRPDHRGPFGPMLNMLEKMIPRAFSLPKKVQVCFEDIKAGVNGEYEEIDRTKTSRYVETHSLRSPRSSADKPTGKRRIKSSTGSSRGMPTATRSCVMAARGQRLPTSSSSRARFVPCGGIWTASIRPPRTHLTPRSGCVRHMWTRSSTRTPHLAIGSGRYEALRSLSRCTRGATGITV